jgi:multiple sugar transport system permease protein
VAISVPTDKPIGRFRRVGREMRREWTAYLYLSPGLIIFAIFSIFAVGFSFYVSFHHWDILNPEKPYVGLQNYKNLAHDPKFRQAVINTIYYAGVSVPLTMAAGLGLAVLLNQKLRALGFFRALYYLPVITPVIAAAIVWKWVFQGDYGLLNYYLQKGHITHHSLLWLNDPNLAMPAVIFMSIWQGAGFAMVIYLAGLQAIPEELYEAAKVDGAGAWRRFRSITLPLLAPTTLFVGVILTIFALQVFPQIFVMTQGGPIGRTTTILYYLWLTGFKYFDMGKAAAMGYLLFALIFIFALIQMRIYRRSAVET